MIKNVTILGAHPLNGFSMRRYTSLLESSYKELGYTVRVLRPTDKFSRRFPKGKWQRILIYIEKLVLFPLALTTLPIGAPIHIADHSDGIWLLHPTLKNTNRILTCHDLFAIRAAKGEIPEHQVGLLGRLYQRFIEKGIGRATKIIAVSHATDSDVRRFYPSIPSSVIWNPLDESIPVLDVRGLREDTYALIVAGVNSWRKRRFLALQVWLEVRKIPHFQGLGLHILGAKLNDTEKALIVAENIDPNSVVVLSNLSDDELGNQYGCSEFLIQASKYEGFAWPILEANIHGVPALCADEPILRETGDGNVFFNPIVTSNDWIAIASQLSDDELADRVRQRAKLFTAETFRNNLRTAIED